MLLYSIFYSFCSAHKSGSIMYFMCPVLKKYVPGPKHTIDWNMIQVEHKGDFRVEPVRILDQKVKVLRNKAIGIVKIQ
jgi:hypothetical protein